MSNKFIISGLPRSGTAHAAMLMNMCHDVFCFHEAIQDGALYKTYQEALDAPDYRFVGDSTTCTFASFDHIEAKRVWVDRNADDCLASYHEAIGDDAQKYWGIALQHKDRWIEKHDPLIISFDRLHSSDNEIALVEARKMVAHCTGIDNLDIGKWRILNRLKVEIFNLNPDYYNGVPIINS